MEVGRWARLPRCWAAPVAPWGSQDAWADSWGDGPAEVLSITLVLTIQRPPPELGDEEDLKVEEE